MKSKIIIALDFASESDAFDFLSKMKHEVEYVKVGLELFIKEGAPLLEKLSNLGYKIFLDLKLHDIPKTMEKALAQLKKFPIHFTTIHFSAGPSAFKHLSQFDYPFSTLGVTALTSLSESEVALIYGEGKSAKDLVAQMMTKAASATFPSGCICSGEEITLVRSLQKRNDFLIITPGVRFDPNQSGDQARVMHPFEALRLGANYLVIGRELTQSLDPLSTWNQWKLEYEKIFN
ncbi:MAG: orotidine-5'-phosphate decarboxylase [Bacteriovoracaceae bacterium]|nr:orotidine-5'-phosphate decarboxylase [Bacteriovoracaceae bacterium]